MNIALYLHVAGGAIGLIAGAIALSLTKGSHRHKQIGHLFVVAMLTMALLGGALSYAAGKPFDVLSSFLSLYMVISGWTAFKPLTQPARRGILALGTICLIGYLGVELYGLATNIRSTDAPPFAGYFFASILGLAVFGDWKHSRRGHTRRQLMLRHMWRMSFGLFIASGSFFGARPHLFPAWMQAYGILLLLTLAPILVMIYWRFRLRARATPAP